MGIKLIFENIKKAVKAKGRRFLFIGIIAISLFIVIGGSYLLYERHRLRFLNRAESKLNIGDIEGAIEDFKKHVMNNSEDYINTIRLAGLLNKEGKREVALNIYERMIQNLKNDKGNKYYNMAIGNLSDLYRYRFDEELKIIESFMQNEKYGEALIKADSLIRFSRMDPFIRLSFHRGDSIKPEDFYSHMALYNYNKANAEKAILLYLVNREKEIDESIGIYANIGLPPTRGYNYKPIYGDEIDYIKERRLIIYELADSMGSNYFDKNNWEKSFNLYEFAFNQRLLVLDSVYDEECLRIRYNMGLTKYNNEKYYSANSIFKEIKKIDGNYETEEINSLIKSCEFNENINKCDRLYKEAKKRFDQEYYIEAVSEFKKSLECLYSIGVRVEDDLVSICKYDMAMAYWNNENYKESLKLLNEIREENKSYEPVIIEEKIQRLEQYFDINK